MLNKISSLCPASLFSLLLISLSNFMVYWEIKLETGTDFCFDKGEDTLKYVREEGWFSACCATKCKVQKLLLRHHNNLFDKTRQAIWSPESTIVKQMQNTLLSF